MANVMERLLIRRGTLAMGVSLALLLTGSVPALAAPPANDDWANRRNASALPFSHTSDIIQATRQGAEPDPLCNTVLRSVWYRYRTPVTRTVLADTFGSDFPTMIAVYTGPLLAGLAPVDCNDGTFQDSVNESQASLAWTAKAGVWYSIQVAKFVSGATAHLAFHLRAVRPHPNDAFANARTIKALPFTGLTSNRNATRQAGEPAACGFNDAGATIWYRFKAPADMPVRASTFGSDFDTQVAVFRGTSVAALVAMACNDDASGGWDGTQSNVAVRLSKGVTYFFRVSGYQGSSGQVVFDLRRARPPTNDRFGGAEVAVSNPYYASVLTRSATRTPEEPLPSCATDGFGQSVWYKLIAPSTGNLTLTDETGGFQTPFRMYVGLYAGTSLATLSEIGCYFLTSSHLVTHAVVSGQTYYLLAGGSGSDSGRLRMTLNVAP